MPSQKVQFTVKGMSRDLADSKFNPEFAFENKNIRITPTENSTLLVLSNEKGNTVIDTHTKYKGVSYTISNRKVLGYAVLYKTIVLFFKANGYDYISTLKRNDADTQWEENILYIGNLNFDESHPIETLPLYEAEDIQKVYWVDGLNQPRVINIINDADHLIRENDDTQFDFVTTLALNEAITIERTTDTRGSFPAGALQYAITYSKKNGQESKIAWISNVHYTTLNDRAGAPDEITTASYKITIDYTTVDTAFDKINFYSIIRTSEDAGLQTRLVTQLDINPEQSQDYVYVDTNLSGETIAPTDLLYKGGEELVADTLATKDNTLFLGNIQYKGNLVPDPVKAAISGTGVSTDYTIIENWEEEDGYYPYKNPLLEDTVTYLRSGNKYRLGVQLQDSKGNWSEPIFVRDFNATVRPTINRTDHSLELPKVQSNRSSNFVTEALSADYKRVRPVIVYPEPSERGVIAQGIVCPTVFRKESRLANNPFAQSSWFFRPYNGNGYDGDVPSKYSVEARHGHSLAGANKYNAEVQSSIGTQPYATNSITNPKDYYVDGSIITFHSPDINDSLVENDLVNSNIKIVGAFAIDSVAGRMSLVATPPYPTNQGYGKVPESQYNVNKTIQSSTDRNLLNTRTVWKTLLGLQPEYFATYPWHKTGLWANVDYITPQQEDYKGTGDIITKVISNTRISQNFGYYNIGDEYILPTGLRSRRLFRKENGDSSYAIEAPDNLSLHFGTLTYKGTIDNPVIPSTSYPIYYSESFDGQLTTVSDISFLMSQAPISVQYRSTDHIVLALENDSSGKSVELPVPYFSSDPQGDKTISKYEGNLFWLTGGNLKYILESDDVIVYGPYADDHISEYANARYIIKCEMAEDDFNWVFTFWTYNEGYISASLSWTDYNIFDISAATNLDSLPLSDNLCVYSTDNGHTWIVTGAYEYNATKMLPSGINSVAAGNEIMWITELIRPIPEGIFGGTTDYAIKSNKWYPCGESKKLDVDNRVIDITEGDTIFNRWDCLKTLPYTPEDTNQIVEIMSFMCESYINTAGRYDKNRGLQDYTFLTSAVPFNQMNPAYDNKDNFFTYRITDLEKSRESDYPTLVTWSLTKTLGEEIDSWTHIVLASSLSMDGDRGKVRALRRFKNSIFAFQDTGIAEIIYNPTTAIATTAGVPIEIANSGKVEGKRYISESIGCTNKWSICTTPAGIYFIDSINKKVYQWSDNGMISLSEQMGFTSWFNTQINKVKSDGWNFEVFDDFVTQYDRSISDVYFINKDKCLTFNESLATFTSFYDYEKTPFFINLDNHCVSVHNGALWEQHAGSYNSFFGVNNRPYYTEVVVNPNPTEDKIFDNIEFRADSWNGNTLLDTTFDYLETRNEYQHGACVLTWLRGYPSTLKKKFRVWYANIPRDDVSKRDRMRNTWLHLKLSKENPGTERTVLHDLQVKYFI